MKAKMFWYCTGTLWGLTTLAIGYLIVSSTLNFFTNLLIEAIQ